ncbi:Hemolysin C [Rickettsiales bacterium Ac37b]|nr:Hemolysin C [Rickettsiales bacterium Ac37b]
MSNEKTSIYSSNIKFNSILYNIKTFFKHICGIHSSSSLEESVAELIEEHTAEGYTISPEEKVILQNVARFGEMKVSDVMIPRTDIVAVEALISLEDLKKILIQQEHTRMPVYRESLDHVIGFIHIKDLLPVLVNEKPFVMEDIIRQLLVVSPSMKVVDLLVKMRLSRVHMALVLDEYGGIDGLATIEDLVEELVGEIQDEHDDTYEPELILLDDSTIEASARLAITKLEKQFNIEIASKDSEDFDTIGGLLLSLVGSVPAQGEKIMYAPASIEFEILESDLRRINRVLVRKQHNFDQNEKD